MSPFCSGKNTPPQKTKPAPVHSVRGLFCVCRGAQIIKAMNIADPNAAAIKRTSSWYNWKSKGLPGYEMWKIDE